MTWDATTEQYEEFHGLGFKDVLRVCDRWQHVQRLKEETVLLAREMYQMRAYYSCRLERVRSLHASLWVDLDAAERERQEQQQHQQQRALAAQAAGLSPPVPLAAVATAAAAVRTTIQLSGISAYLLGQQPQIVSGVVAVDPGVPTQQSVQPAARQSSGCTLFRMTEHTAAGVLAVLKEAETHHLHMYICTNQFGDALLSLGKAVVESGPGWEGDKKVLEMQALERIR